MDLKHKTFVHTFQLRDSAVGSVMYPMDVLRLIRENSGKVVRAWLEENRGSDGARLRDRSRRSP